MPKVPLTPLSQLRVSTHQIPSHSFIPNTSLHNHPLYIYHQAFPPSTSASALESHLDSTSVVAPKWRYSMYSITHYHSTSHEVLCVFSGRAKLVFGGEGNPGKVEEVLEAGDAVIVPAGVGHRLLEDLSGSSFEMVGSYPVGCTYDMCYGKKGEEKKAEASKDVPWFERDPLYGDEGPVLGEERKE